MSIKSILVARLARLLSEDSGPTQLKQVKSLRNGVLTVEKLPYGRRATYQGLDKRATAVALNGEFNVSEEHLCDLMEPFLPADADGSRALWADLARWHVAQRTANGARISVETIAKSLSMDAVVAMVSSDEDGVAYPVLKDHVDDIIQKGHLKGKSHAAHFALLTKAVDLMTVAFAGQAPDTKGLLRVTMDGRSVADVNGTAPEVAKEFGAWVKRLTAAAAGGTSKGGLVAGLAKFAGVCLVLFGLLFAYGSYLQSSGGVALTSGAASVSQGAIGAAPPIVAPLNEDDLRARAYGNRLKGAEGNGTFDVPTTSMIDDNKISSIESLSPENFKKIGGASALPMRKSGDVVFAFSNPTCSACRHLETQLDQLDEASNPVVIPVAFDEQGMRVGTAVMCSADPAAAWRKVMSGGSIDTPLCIDGLKQMEKNSLLFAELGFKATPTIVATDGRAMIGSVAAAALGKWMRGAL